MSAATKIDLPSGWPLGSFNIISGMRCTICGAITHGSWRVSRKTQRPGVDHILDCHRAELLAGQLSPPLFRDWIIFDPFWDEEHGLITGDVEEATDEP